MPAGLEHFVLHRLHVVALALFLALYGVKLWRLLRLPQPAESGAARSGVARAVLGSYGAIIWPASMESTRRSPGRWLAFGIYHLGILAAIVATFTIPFAPQLMTRAVRLGSALLLGLAIVAGWLKIYWRLRRPEVRAVSTPEDYFSLAILEVWFAVAIAALLLDTRPWLVVYFALTSLLLVYVPLSKISHYIYWFFTRFLFGLRYGRRGVA